MPVASEINKTERNSDPNSGKTICSRQVLHPSRWLTGRKRRSSVDIERVGLRTMRDVC